MAHLSFLKFFSYAEVILCVAALCFIVFKRQWRDYWALGSFLAFRAASGICLAFLIYDSGKLLSVHATYDFYFYVYWVGFAVMSILTFFILYGVFRFTMTPLKGLEKLGRLAFFGLAVVAVAVILWPAFAPHMTGAQQMIAVISHAQRAQSILTLCLLPLVWFGIRYMGLSARSNVFGVSVGLGLLAINDLALSAWLASHPNTMTLYTMINGIVICAVLAIWTAYFALREPRRRQIALPPSSLLMRLNRMGLAWSAR